MRKRKVDSGIPQVREPVSLYEAKTNLSELVELAANGTEIVIMKSGKPMARLGPLTPERPSRVSGQGRGAWVVKPGFDDPLPEDVLGLFEPE